LPDSLGTLRNVNKNLRHAMLRLRPERKHICTLHPEDLIGLRNQISQADGCLRWLPGIAEATEDVRKELLEYRHNLEKLKHFLPDLHARLLAEQSRLAAARSHAAAAAHWAHADTELSTYCK